MIMRAACLLFLGFFFNDTATTEIYTLSLHDALPIWVLTHEMVHYGFPSMGEAHHWIDRKSTRLNSSHLVISYAVFCLKKKYKHTASLLRLRSASDTQPLPAPHPSRRASRLCVACVAAI